MNHGRCLVIDGGPRSIAHRPSAILLPCFLALTLAAPALAKGPTLDHLYPAGGPRGSTVQVEASGQFERWPVRAWSSEPSIEVEPGAEKGRLSVTIAPDAPAGLYWIRLYDDEGVTAPRPFLVGLLPEANEVEPNDDPSTARLVDPRGETINGRLGKTGDVDGFRVPLKQGQTLIAALEANHRLGSPMDGVLQVASAAGFVLAQVDDAPGRDPRVAFEAPSDGDYLVRAFAFPFVQESSIRFAGSPSYVYRLTLTTGGYADHAFPLAVARGAPAEVEAVGWNIPESARRIRVEAVDGPAPVAVEAAGLAGPVEVQVAEGPSLVEVEPNDRTHPQPIPIPSAISGRVDRPGDVDVFAFTAKKGQAVNFQLDSRSLGLPLDAVLRVGDASGSTLVEVDDEGMDVDPALKFTAPSDGTFRVTIRDLNGQGGPLHAYLLTAGPPRADFALNLKADQLGLVPGQSLEVAVAVARLGDYAGPIEVGLDEPYEGVTAEPVVSKKGGPTASSVTLKLLARKPIRPGPVRIVGVAADGRRRFATATAGGSSARIDSAWLSPAKPPPAPPAPAPK